MKSPSSKTRTFAATAAPLLLLQACGAEPTKVEPSPSSGGSGGRGGSGLSGSGGANTTGGASAVGGTGGGTSGASGTGGVGGVSGGAGAGMSALGGNSGVSNTSGSSGTGPAGGAGVGGVASAGSAGGGAAGTAGTGGASTGGAGAASGGTGGASNAVNGSTGCGKSTGIPMNVSVPNAIVTFPNGYDGSTPVPLMFGFHGANRTHQEFYEVDARTEGSELEKHFVMVYLKAAGSGWASSDKSRLDTAYDQLTQDHCIDTNRVFATGHSSGAHFIEVLLCGGETRLKGVALVSGSKQCASWAAVPAMLIHGTNDQERVSLGDADGQQELGPFVESNGCGSTTTPYAAAMSCNSIYNQASVDNGCVSYAGCSAPFVFCSHDDQNYGGTNHGWPCFANQTMYAFLSAI
jgi:polyhydroxybutyrate depolymerase